MNRDAPDRREHLEKLEPGAEDDAEYQHAHDVGRRFGRALTTMFFETTALSDLTKRYGVF